MQPWAESFYKSKEWKHCRTIYAKTKANLCERCLAKGYIVPGEIVHHKTHLTPENISDPNITLNWDNLELVCRNCHADLHSESPKRYHLDDFGRVIFM